MKDLTVFAAFFVIALCCSLAAAQQPDSNPRKLSHWTDGINREVGRFVNRFDLETRRALTAFSDRQLRYFVGSYWIDQHDSLIDRRNREVGIWGVEAPAGDLLRTDRSPILGR